MSVAEIIAVLVMLLLAYITWNNIQKRKKVEEKAQLSDLYLQKNHSLQAVIKEGKAENERLSKIIDDEQEKVRERDKTIKELEKENNELFNEKDGLYRKYEDLISVDPSKLRLGPKQDIVGILKGLEFPFTNSAIITMGVITLKAEELIQEDHIKVIKGLNKINLFPISYQNEFNFDPKTLEVKFKTIVYDEDEPIAIKSWLDFLKEREHFIKTITSYVEGVINQRQINQAVDLALNGKEATSA